MKINSFASKESCQPDFFRKGNKTEEKKKSDKIITSKKKSS